MFRCSSLLELLDAPYFPFCLEWPANISSTESWPRLSALEWVRRWSRYQAAHISLWKRSWVWPIGFDASRRDFIEQFIVVAAQPCASLRDNQFVKTQRLPPSGQVYSANTFTQTDPKRLPLPATNAGLSLEEGRGKRWRIGQSL